MGGWVRAVGGPGSSSLLVGSQLVPQFFTRRRLGNRLWLWLWFGLGLGRLGLGIREVIFFGPTPLGTRFRRDDLRTARQAPPVLVLSPTVDDRRLPILLDVRHLANHPVVETVAEHLFACVRALEGGYAQ